MNMVLYKSPVGVLCANMWALVMTVLLLAARETSGDGVSVVRVSLPLDTELQLAVNNSIEYIVELILTAEQIQWPTRLRAELVDSTGPVLLTARRGLETDTWQIMPPLPATERTLCASGDAAAACGRIKMEGVCEYFGDNLRFNEGEPIDSTWSIHISSACNSSLRLYGTSARDWTLSTSLPLAVATSLGAPRLLYYQWGENTRVRLELTADDDVCTTVAVVNYTCPLAQSITSLQQRGGMRMTMLRAAGAHIKRSSYPLGFVVTLMVQESDSACGISDGTVSSEWLWDAAIGVDAVTTRQTERDTRSKSVTVTVKDALPAGRYWLACGVTLLVFIVIYAVAGALLYFKHNPAACNRVFPCCAQLIDDNDETNVTIETPRRTVDVVETAINSDSDTENPQQTPDTGSLRLAALSRRRARTLAARWQRYLPTLLIVGTFYALPALQLVAAFQLVLNVSGELDLCYYNQLCAHPLGPLSDFNHVFSNIGYVLLGALYVMQVRLARSTNDAASVKTGVPPQSGLLGALGVGLALLGIMSASYHICPNRLNFQFDTAFMYVLAVLAMVCLHGARRPDFGVRASAAFGSLAALMALVVAGVLGGGPAFWAIWSALHVSVALALSLRVYYVQGEDRLKQWRLGVMSVNSKPRYTATLVTLLIANGANWTLAVYGLVTQPSDFASHLLTVLLANALLSLLAYLANKLVHKERPPPHAWALLATAALIWPGALYFFLWGASDWSTTAALSRHYNHQCLMLSFYDSHDLWHLLSATALYFTFSALLVWDDDLKDVPREQIAVF